MAERVADIPHGAGGYQNSNCRCAVTIWPFQTVTGVWALAYVYRYYPEPAGDMSEGPQTRPVQADWRPGSQLPGEPRWCYVFADGRTALGSWDGTAFFWAGKTGPVEWWAPLIPSPFYTAAQSSGRTNDPEGDTMDELRQSDLEREFPGLAFLAGGERPAVCAAAELLAAEHDVG